MKLISCTLLLLAVSEQATAFASGPLKLRNAKLNNAFASTLYLSQPSSTSTNSNTTDIHNNHWFPEWAAQNSIEINDKVSIREPLEEDRGKGGVTASADIQALEVLARIPRSLILTPLDAPTRAIEAAAKANNFSWAADLAASTLAALHPLPEESPNQQEWIQQWQAGGWATDNADLGPPEANFGSAGVTGSLMATGSDNDYNVYAKFRMPCHPVLMRASIGLGVLTGCTEDEARDALTVRGKWYRSMRDALQELVLESSPRDTGSKRERRCWDVADALSRVLARATYLQLEDKDDNPIETTAIVPLHERLGHNETENTKLVASGEQVLLVATRDIQQGQAIARDYTKAPKLDGDASQGALHLLLQFGLPPQAW